MIDRADGSLQFESPPVRVAADFTLEQFQSSALFAIAKPLNQNAPWRRFECKRLGIAGEEIAAAFCFKDGRLHSFGLAVLRPEFGSSWSDWSEEKEQSRLKLHHELLRKWLGPGDGRYQFAWGTVESDFDIRSGESSIEVTYGRSGR
jgi:hypothetical protein